MLQRLLDGLAGSGLPGLKTHEDGCFALTFDEQITVNLDYDDQIGILTFHCRLGPIEPDRTAVIYPLLLEANVLWAGTGGATLGVMPEDRCVVLAYQERAAAIDGPRFENLLAGMVDAAEFWMRQIEDASTETVASRVEDPWLYDLRV